MNNVNFPIDIVQKINSPDRERLLRFLDSSQKLEADEVNLMRDGLNYLYELIQKAGLDRQKAEYTTKPIPTGFYRYSISAPGTYIYFLDAQGQPIIVYPEDMSSGIVEIWVNNGISEKVIQYINISEQVEEGINNILGKNSLTLFIDSSEGDFIDATNLRTILTATVERYFKDFTHQVIQWQWFRESGKTQADQDSDAIWSLGKNKRIIELTQEDFTQNIYDHSITFMCQAIVEGQTITARMSIG
ncbi:hypothetical protein ACPDHJ_05815 [Myroides sp. C8-3]|uniref:hypothetical protein n=1 Tax=Myroides sp. C8-3 TaxID=3400533 RepID=UPI003D2F5274